MKTTKIDRAPELSTASGAQEILSSDALENLEREQSEKFGTAVKAIPVDYGIFAWVDEADYDHVRSRSWHLAFSESGRGLKILDGQTSISLGKWIAGVAWNSLIDHRNGDPTDNRRVNLRLVTIQQNVLNAVKRKARSATGYLGVYKDRGIYMARVGFNGKGYYIRGFTTAIETARARDDLAFKLHGEFGVYNFHRPEFPEHTTRLWTGPDYVSEIKANMNISLRKCLNSTGYRGVVKSKNRYRGYQNINGRTYKTESYSTPKEAAEAREVLWVYKLMDDAKAFRPGGTA